MCIVSKFTPRKVRGVALLTKLADVAPALVAIPRQAAYALETAYALSEGVTPMAKVRSLASSILNGVSQS